MRNKLLPKNPIEYFQAFRVGKLYYKFIKGTQLEALGWTGEMLARWLEDHLFIKRIKHPIYNSKGEILRYEEMYVELAGKLIPRKNLLKYLMQEDPAINMQVTNFNNRRGI